MNTKYILDGHEVIPCESIFDWAKWFENAWPARRVAETIVGDKRVSTVFLGINHQFGDGAPLLFETMIFGDEGDDYQTRCSTWAEAEEMHRKAVATLDAENPL